MVRNLALLYARELDMPVDDFIRFRDYIHEKSGIYFAENKMYLLADRLSKRMADLGITAFRDYFYQVKYDTTLQELNTLINLVTTAETSFFRHLPQLQAFSEEVLPILMDPDASATGPRTIRIWSAGCSTGEEPYTLAILARQYLKENTDWKVEILASDISEVALQTARRAEYSEASLRNVPADLLERHFTKSGDTYKVSPETRGMVKFAQSNLNDPRRLPLSEYFDIIFCRNVMPYFSDDAKRRLVRSFYNSLHPGGFLFIGHSETLHGLSKAFQLVYLRNALVYCKLLNRKGTSLTAAKEHYPQSTKNAGAQRKITNTKKEEVR